ncbi:MAG: hypothetical protein HQK70_06360 [Desulfamplus sp.]|nr:hypothetical protein [Desulfamplus sp.]
MKAKFVTDTMAIVLRLEKRKLPKRIRQIFKDAECGNVDLYISRYLSVIWNSEEL